jgi:hypothetical protein
MPYHAFAFRTGTGGGAATVANQNVGGLRLVSGHYVSRANSSGPWYYAALHEYQAGTQVLLLEQVKGANLRAVNTRRSQLGLGRRRCKDTGCQGQDWKPKTPQLPAFAVCIHRNLLFDLENDTCRSSKYRTPARSSCIQFDADPNTHRY